MKPKRVQEKDPTLSTVTRFVEAVDSVLEQAEQSHDRKFWRHSWDEVPTFGIVRTNVTNRRFNQSLPDGIRLDVSAKETQTRILGFPMPVRRELSVSRSDSNTQASSRVQLDLPESKVEISARARDSNDINVLLPIVVHKYKPGEDFYEQALSLGISFVEVITDRVMNETS